jgi:phospholipid/cholesterol/gamma-HCH transport system permease protein
VSGDVTRLTGAVTIDRVADLSRQFAVLPSGNRATLDLSGVTRLDTAGAWVLTDLERRLKNAGGSLVLEGADEKVSLLLATVRAALPHPVEPRRRERGLLPALAAIGRAVSDGAQFLGQLIAYLGLFVLRTIGVIVRPSRFRLTALVVHAEDVGLRAVPIVALMAFLIGVVLAFQGAAQLQQFGAEIFVVDLIAISILRELGILLTAIIVAGRTASAFTAAIGSMKMREEIDAMRTLGLDPGFVLIVPRVLALVLTLPILGLVANIAGLAGGALMSWIELGITPDAFRVRLLDGEYARHALVGLIKAPVFAVIIGVVGCHAGMQVRGDAESLGRKTSGAVVTAIFSVIVADALFSIFFAEAGW